MTDTERDYSAIWFWDAVTVAGLFIFLGGFAVIGYQGYLWLKEGEWSPFEFRTAWYFLGGSEPRFTWLGVQKIALAILDGPLSGVTMTSGAIISWVGGVNAKAAREQPSRYGLPHD